MSSVEWLKPWPPGRWFHFGANGGTLSSLWRKPSSEWATSAVLLFLRRLTPAAVVRRKPRLKPWPPGVPLERGGTTQSSLWRKPSPEWATSVVLFFLRRPNPCCCVRRIATAEAMASVRWFHFGANGGTLSSLWRKPSSEWATSAVLSFVFPNLDHLRVQTKTTTNPSH